jgi:restriction endonuclease S subunit
LENKKILEAINRAYAEAETPQEAEVREKAKKYYRKRLKTEKW